MKIIDREYDVAVIGAGILGLAHAYEAAVRGKKVLLLERNQFALGASVRNFGLIWPIGQPKGPMLDRALRSQEVWKQLSHEAGFWLNQNGSLHLAYFDDEWEVLNQFMNYAADAGYSCELINPAAIQKLSPMAKADRLYGGLLSTQDCTVDPREAIRRLPLFLQEKFNVDLHFGRTVTGIDLPYISTFDEQFRARQVIICSGVDFETLFPGLLQNSNLEKCKLQMMRMDPVTRPIGPSLCAGLTLRHYDAFSACEGLKKLTERYHRETPHYEAHGIHVLVSQNESGQLIVGDTHEYGPDHYPFNQARLDGYVLEYLSTFFHADDLEIAERWEGIYPKIMDGKTELILQPMENVLIVNGIGGAGMTLSFGLAQENMDWFLV